MPDHAHTNRGASFDTLFEAPAPGGPLRGGSLPAELRRYGDRLAIPMRVDRAVVVVNFVSSLDGVITLDPRTGNGAEISGFNEPDRFVMGLLRTLADAVIVGAGTVRAAGGHEWTPRRVHPAYAEAYAAWRRKLGLAPQPTTVVVTATRDVPAD